LLQKSKAKLKALADEIPTNLVNFDFENDKAKFNTIGLYGTRRDLPHSFYRVQASGGGLCFNFNEPDWKAVT